MSGVTDISASIIVKFCEYISDYFLIIQAVYSNCYFKSLIPAKVFNLSQDTKWVVYSWCKQT